MRKQQLLKCSLVGPANVTQRADVELADETRRRAGESRDCKGVILENTVQAVMWNRDQFVEAVGARILDFKTGVLRIYLVGFAKIFWRMLDEFYGQLVRAALERQGLVVEI